MKKILVILFIFLLSGCLLRETYISCIDEILHGKWINETKELSLSIDKNEKEIIFNDSLIGTYYIPKKNHGTMWVWDKPQKDIHELIWNINGFTGNMFFVDFNKSCNFIFLKGVPFCSKDSIIKFKKIENYN